MSTFFLVFVLITGQGQILQYRPVVQFKSPEACVGAIPDAMSAAVLSLDKQQKELVESGKIRVRFVCVQSEGI